MSSRSNRSHAVATAVALTIAVCVTGWPAAADNGKVGAPEAPAPAASPVAASPDGSPATAASPPAESAPASAAAVPVQVPEAAVEAAPAQAAGEAPAAGQQPAAAADAGTPADAAPAEQPAGEPPARPESAAEQQSVPSPAPDVAAPTAPPAPPVPAPLKIATEAGAYGEVFERIVVDPFRAETSSAVDTVPADAPEADVIGLDLLALERRCAAGELREITVGAASTAASDDQVAGSAARCGVAMLAWSSVFVFDRAAFGKKPPATLQDVFNVKAFPGRRALPRSGRGVLEAASVASGVPAGEVYTRLAAEGGLAQPLDRLASLGSTNVVWYDTADEALELLRSGKASIALTTNSRAFLDSVRRGPLEVIWDGQVYDVEYLAIRTASSDPDKAARFVTFATAPERLAAIASEIPYGPMRRSAVTLVSRHPVTGDDVQPFIPTSDDKLSTAVRFDPAWWQAHAATVALSVAEATRYRPGPGAPPLPRQRQTQR